MCAEIACSLTAKLRPFAINTTLETALVPPAHGRTHCPEASAALQDEPGPLTGSNPAAKAKDWKSVIENPKGPTPYSLVSKFMIGMRL
jgi:hypothetical protein